MAKQGERKTVWDPVKRVYKTVPVNPPKEQGVTEGSNDTIYPNAEVIKLRNGRPIGEIYQDENGWGFFHYRMDSGNDFIDSREDAIEGLRDLHQETVRSRPDYTIKGVAEGSKTPTDWMGVPTKLAKNDKKPIKRPSGYDEYIKQGAKQGFQDDPTNPLRKKVKEQGVAEAELDEAKTKRTVEDIFIKGKKVGSITTTTTQSGMIFYTAQVGNSFVAGPDTREEALKHLKRLYRDSQKEQGVAEGDRPGMKDGRPYSDPLRRHPGNDSYMTPEYLIQKYQDELKKIAAGPYKRPKDVAMYQARIAKLQRQQGVAEGVRDLGYDAQSLIMKLRRDVEEKRLQPTPQAVLAAARELAGDMEFAPQLLVKQVLGQGVAEGGYPEVDHMPGPTIKRTQTGCKRCHGKGYVYKTDDGEVHPMNRPDAKKYKCGKCSGIGFVKSDVAEEKIKGADGKACWPGYRYNGTENGKDDCVKVKESSILEGLQQVDEINWKHAAAAGAMALGALGGAGQAQAQFNPSGLSDVYLQQVVSGEHQRPMVSIDAAKAELQARMNGKQQKVSPQSDSGSNKPFTPVDYQTKEPLKKGADGKWYNSNGEERDGLHGGPISAQGTAMHRGLKLRQ
jgi:hypothetical protein